MQTAFRMFASASLSRSPRDHPLFAREAYFADLTDRASHVTRSESIVADLTGRACALKEQSVLSYNATREDVRRLHRTRHRHHFSHLRPLHSDQHTAGCTCTGRNVPGIGSSRDADDSRSASSSLTTSPPHGHCLLGARHKRRTYSQEKNQQGRSTQLSHPSYYSHSLTMQFLALASLLLACGPLAASAMGILFPLYFYPSTTGSDCSAWQPLIDA
jgi:hypothetical protein